jgi:hypothetical protein
MVLPWGNSGEQQHLTITPTSATSAIMSIHKQLRSRTFEKGSLCDLIASNPSCFSRIEDWESEQLKRLNCQVLPISDHSSTTKTIIPIEDGRVADALDELYRERVTSRKDEIARELFRLLVPVNQPAFGAKEYVLPSSLVTGN